MSRSPGWTVVAAALVGCLAACTGASPGSTPPPGVGSGSPPATSPPATSPSPVSPSASTSPSPSVTPTDPAAAADAVVRPIGDAQWARIVEAGVWRKGCPVAQDGLRRVEVSYHDFSGGVSRGALVVNADVAPSIARIFTRLFEVGFPIERMRPIEAYDGDDLASMTDDNTSAFNCRKPAQANSPSDKSPHANGRAVDINPYRNPWKDPRCTCWQPSPTYAKQPRTAPGSITTGSPIWRIFTHEGWIWQDISVTDYMHFDTGYPSRPLAAEGAAEAS